MSPNDTKITLKHDFSLNEIFSIVVNCQNRNGYWVLRFRSSGGMYVCEGIFLPQSFCLYVAEYL